MAQGEGAKERASALAGSATQEARAVAAAARGEASAVASEMKGQALNLVEQAKSAIRGQASDGTARAAGALDSLSTRLHALADGDADKAGDLRRFAGDLGETLGRLAGRLDERGLDGMVDELQAFARRRPGVFLAAAATAGFVAGRLFRSGMAESESGSSGGTRAVPTSSTGPISAPTGSTGPAWASPTGSSDRTSVSSTGASDPAWVSSTGAGAALPGEGAPRDSEGLR
jgi:hypothetical protein